MRQSLLYYTANLAYPQTRRSVKTNIILFQKLFKKQLDNGNDDIRLNIRHSDRKQIGGI